MELLFVYNAEKDIVNGIIDYAHKVFKPSTYKCDLCALTHHNLGQRNAWKSFKTRTNSNLSFHYIKGFEKEFNESYDYPVILERRSGENRVILSREEISEIKTIEDFVDRIELLIQKTDLK